MHPHSHTHTSSPPHIHTLTFPPSHPHPPTHTHTSSMHWHTLIDLDVSASAHSLMSLAPPLTSPSQAGTMVTIGYDVTRFEDDVDEELICTICGQVGFTGIDRLQPPFLGNAQTMRREPIVIHGSCVISIRMTYKVRVCQLFCKQQTLSRRVACL